jgi:hypothetical protein
MSSPFYQHFKDNGRTKQRAVSQLRENLADACEGFAFLTEIPQSQRRFLLLKELKRLADHYRQSEHWDGIE